MEKSLLALASGLLLVVAMGCVDSSKPSAPSVDAGPDSAPVPTMAEICGDLTAQAASCPGLNDPVDSFAMARAMGFGANIGNTLENTARWETGWGQPLITQTFINGMASRGIKSVRVPVAWDTYATNGVVDPSKMARVREVTEWILAAGMVAIVNIHWDGGWIFNEKDIIDAQGEKIANPYKYRLTDEVKAKFASYWKQIGAAFADVGHGLIFEGLNEEAQFYVNGAPNGAPDIAALNQINQLFVNTVRSQGAYNFTRALLIAGFGTDINRTCVDSFAVPTDPAGAGRLFLSLHFYDPSPFTILEEEASWGKPVATWGTEGEQRALEAQLGKAASFGVRRGIPVIIGEFGVTLGLGKKAGNVKRESASRILWMTSVIKACFARGMVPMLWDCGTDINRSDGSFSPDLQAVIANFQ
jgi:endoglucanase